MNKSCYEEVCSRLRKLAQHNETVSQLPELEEYIRKNFDFIVLNSLNDKGAGFRCDTNKIAIIDRDGITAYPLKPKTEVATDIIDKLVTLF